MLRTSSISRGMTFWCPGRIPGWLCARQTPYPLYHFSGPCTLNLIHWVGCSQQKEKHAFTQDFTVSSAFILFLFYFSKEPQFTVIGNWILGIQCSSTNPPPVANFLHQCPQFLYTTTCPILPQWGDTFFMFGCSRLDLEFCWLWLECTTILLYITDVPDVLGPWSSVTSLPPLLNPSLP